MVHWLDVRALLTANAVLTIDVTLGTSAKLVTNVLEIGYRMTPTTSLISEMHAVVARTFNINTGFNDNDSSNCENVLVRNQDYGAFKTVDNNNAFDCRDF